MLEERFYSLGRYLKNVFDERVHRIGVQIPGVSREASGGYSLCAGGTLAATAYDALTVSIAEQINNAKERIRQRFKFGKFMVHLHAGSDVLVSMDSIRSAVDEITRDNEVMGLAITLRPSCLTPEMAEFLKLTSRHLCTWLELGVHTMHDETLRRIGCNHTSEQVREGILALMRTRIHIAPHMVFGLPGETAEMMRQSMKAISHLNIEGINIHNMYVLKGTPMEQQYAAGEIGLLAREEYIGLVCDFIEVLPPKVVLHGIVGTVPEERLLAPDWTLLRKENLDMISTELEKRGSMQGQKINELYVVVQPAAPEQKTDELHEVEPPAGQEQKMDALYEVVPPAANE